MRRAVAPRIGLAAGLVTASLAGTSLPAQEVKASGAPPAEVAAEAIAFFNRPETIRITGEFRVPAGNAVAGGVAVLGGPLTIAGRIEGRVVVLNGDVRLDPGAEVAGDLLVVGGVLSGDDGTAVSGVVVVYPAGRLGFESFSGSASRVGWRTKRT